MADMSKKLFFSTFCCCVILAAAAWIWIKAVTTVHFVGCVGVHGERVYAFPEKQFAGLCGVTAEKGAFRVARQDSTSGKFPDASKVIHAIQVLPAIATTQTGLPSWEDGWWFGPHGSFALTIPRDKLPKDDNLVIVSIYTLDLRQRDSQVWFRVVRIPEDVQSHKVDLGRT